MPLKDKINLALAFRDIKARTIVSQSEIEHRDIHFYEQYMSLRTAFALKEGWPINTQGVDEDYYDAELGSHYVVAHDGKNVVAGARFTRVDFFYESLSYHMWQNAVDVEEFNQIPERHGLLLDRMEEKELWDVTRLMTNAGIKSEKTAKERIRARIGILKVLLAATKFAGNQNSVWIFTINDPMKRFLQRYSVPVVVLASGKISVGDIGKSHLCLVNIDVAKRAYRRRTALSQSLSKRKTKS